MYMYNMPRPFYLRYSFVSHPLHHFKCVVGCLVAPATQMEPKRPVRWHEGTTDDLWKSGGRWGGKRRRNRGKVREGRRGVGGKESERESEREGEKEGNYNI